MTFYYSLSINVSKEIVNSFLELIIVIKNGDGLIFLVGKAIKFAKVVYNKCLNLVKG
jgi:hypothetical protein